MFFVAILCVFFFLVRRKKNDENILIDLRIIIPLAIIMLSSFASVFWGISHGDAFYGFMHILTAVVFLAFLNTFSNEEKQDAIGVIPYAALAMIILTAIAYVIPGLKDIVYVNGRMGGPFEYPNTFGLFILIGLYVFVESISLKKWKIKDYIITFVILAGILMTGSRSIFIMTICLSVYILFSLKGVRKTYSIILAVSMVLAGIYLFITGDVSSIGRFLTTSVHSSTFLGRILYDIDAFKMILSRPFGYGYLGYYYIQHFFQSGIYSVRFVHNDWLQIALDYGVISLVAFGYLYGLGLYRADTRRRVVLLLVGIHMLFDFDLQYFAILMIVLICFSMNQLSDKQKGVIVLRRTPLIKGIANTSLVLFLLTYIWLGVADFMQSHNMREESLYIYPWTADVKLHAIAETNDKEVRNQYAEELVDDVQYVGPAYEVLSEKAMDEGDVYTAMEMRRNSVIYQKYSIDKYEEYATLLCDIIDTYKDTDKEIVNKALSNLSEIPELINKTESETSAIAYIINDAPEFTMSNEVVQRIVNILFTYKNNN